MMDQETQIAFDWARNTTYQSVAARYAKTLAGEVERLQRYPAAIKQLRGRQFTDQRVCDDIEQMVREAAG